MEGQFGLLRCVRRSRGEKGAALLPRSFGFPEATNMTALKSRLEWVFYALLCLGLAGIGSSALLAAEPAAGCMA